MKKKFRRFRWALWRRFCAVNNIPSPKVVLNALIERGKIKQLRRGLYEFR